LRVAIGQRIERLGGEGLGRGWGEEFEYEQARRGLEVMQKISWWRWVYEWLVNEVKFQ
jgi:hypothetical protein